MLELILPALAGGGLLWGRHGQSIAEIQSRLSDASPGQLSLAGAEEGQLSLAVDPAGQLSIRGGEELS